MSTCLCGGVHPGDDGLTRRTYWGRGGEILFEQDPGTPHHLDIVWSSSGQFVGACLPRGMAEQLHGPLVASC